jgi:hypothetical protein
MLIHVFRFLSAAGRPFRCAAGAERCFFIPFLLFIIPSYGLCRKEKNCFPIDSASLFMVYFFPAAGSRHTGAEASEGSECTHDRFAMKACRPAQRGSMLIFLEGKTK